MNKKILKTIIALISDLIIAGLLLCVFALFHHVIPKKRNMNDAISIPKPTTSATSFKLPDFGGTSFEPESTPTVTSTDHNSVTDNTSSPEITIEPQKTPEHQKTPTPSKTHKPTVTSDTIAEATSTNTSAPTKTITPTINNEAIMTATPTVTATQNVTATPTVTATQTVIPTSTETATPIVTVKPTSTPVQTQTPSGPIQTDNLYRSDNVFVTMKTVQVGSSKSKVTYHLADIYVTNVECFRTAFADNTYGDNFSQDVLEQDLENDAIVAISGDSYGISDPGIVLRNGILYRYANTSADICVLYYDGRMETLSPGEYTRESLISDGAYQVWTFGPELLDKNGKAKTNFNAEDYIMKAHPRAAIGYYEPGHYVFVLVDGRQNGYSKGLNIPDLAKLFEELGCKAAYNLDGGISAVMTFNDSVYSHPDRTREVTDILYIGEP